MRRDDLSLFDTNLLVYATFKDLPFHKVAKKIRDSGLTGALRACLTPQVLTEFYSIVTSRKRVVKPLPPSIAAREVENYLRADSITKVYMKATTPQRIVELAREFEVTGARIFDVQLIATMLDNGIRRIYTANEEDFERFGEIEVVNPFKR